MRRKRTAQVGTPTLEATWRYRLEVIAFVEIVVLRQVPINPKESGLMAKPLNKTESRAFSLYVQGLTRQEIARELGQQRGSVDHVFVDIRNKLGIEPRGIDIGQWVISRIPREVLIKYI